MKKTALALASALLLLAACDSSSSDLNGATGNGSNGAAAGYGVGNGSIGKDANGQDVGDHILFETDSSVVTAEGQSTLQHQAEWLKANTKINVTIEGHADERGTREYNLALGERRATATKNYLASVGISANRISTTSFGKERPAVTGNDESAWSQNRRSVTVIAN